ncbi:MAG: peptidoglycan-binding protein [Candidatus Pacebacteria bacterium]|nr:peptidoglycan-binding protein [Candidatus Paceibacterota bacterium]
MKKTIISGIIIVTMFFAAAPIASANVSFDAATLSLLTQILLSTGDYEVEEVLSVITVLSTLESTSSSSDVILPAGDLCTFRYNGDESVMAIQQELQNQGYTITKVDGKIGPETRAAVTAFQTDAGAAKIDGLIGQETRNLLLRESLVCLGDTGVTVSADQSVSTEMESEVGEEIVSEEVNVISTGNSICSFSYNGDSSTMAIQQELQNQGYTITKVDGKIGPETRAAVTAFETANNLSVDGEIDQDMMVALTKASLTCNFTSAEPVGSSDVISDTEVIALDQIAESDTSVVVETDGEVVVPSDVTVVGDGAALNDFVVKDEVLAAIRTSGQTPDDTAVFTYRMTLNPDANIFISTNPELTFDVNIYNGDGNLVSTEQFKSIVSSAEKILRDDRTSYFRIKQGDSISLRATAQPGPGVYYAELGRFTFTSENAQTILNPTVTNYGLDSNVWRTGTITLQN